MFGHRVNQWRFIHHLYIYDVGKHLPDTFGGEGGIEPPKPSNWNIGVALFNASFGYHGVASSSHYLREGTTPDFFANRF